MPDINTSNRSRCENNEQDGRNIPELSLCMNLLGKWSRFFVNRYRITFLLMAIILFWGASKYMMLQKEAQPKVTIPFAFVRTIYVGASPEEIESLVTDPIEKKLETIENVKRMTSNSDFGYSTVMLEFEQGVDVQEKVRETKEILSGIQRELPDGVEEPIVSDMKTGDSPILVFSLSGSTDFATIQEYSDKVKKEMELVKGVREVQLVGELQREIIVTIDPEKLSAYNIGIGQIRNAVSASNVNLPGGNVNLNGINYIVRTVGRFDYVDKLGDVVIKQANGGQILLKDIATIEDGFKERSVHARKSYGIEENSPSMEEAIVIAVKKKESVDDVSIKKNVLEMLDKKKGTLIPSDLRLELISDKAEYVDKQLGSVTDNAKSGLFLVIVVLFLFIGLGESMIVSFVIPLSIFAALGLMQVTGMTLNNVSMFSLVLAIGMLVDNAIVVMENIDRLRFKGLTAKEAAIVGTNQIAPAILASTLTTLAAFFPLALTSGIMGDFIRPIPMTVIFALTCSFIIAITVTPSICSIVLKKHRSENKGKEHPVRDRIFKISSVVLVLILSMLAFMDWGKEGFERFGILSYTAGVLFSGAMFVKLFIIKKTHEDHIVIKKYSEALLWIISKGTRKFIAIALVVVIFIMSVSLIPLGVLKINMFGSEDYPTMYININTPPGTILSDTFDITKQVEKKLYSIKEIKSFVSYTGNEGVDIWSDLGIGGEGVPNIGRIIIELYDLREREKTSMQIAEDLRNIMGDISGAQIKIDELQSGPPTGAPIYLKIKGENLEELQKTAQDFESIIKDIDGTRDTKTSIGDGAPEIQIRVDKNKAAMLGLDDMTVAMDIRNILNGVKITTFRDGQNEIDVVVKTSDSSLKVINDIENINFISKHRERIPFSQIAEIVETKSPVKISHEDRKRVIVVSSNIEEGKITATEAVDQFNQRVKDYPLPDGVVIQFGGESEAMGDSFNDMMVNMVVAAILIYIILAIQFNSLSQPGIILLTVPMAVIGVIAGLIITGNNFGFVAFVGLVALVGIAVNDAIVLVDYINYLRANGQDMKSAIIDTGKTRFLPVLATTITTAGGILPITLKDPFFEPMGIALIFGLCTATLLTLVLVPIVYSIIEEFKIRVKGKISKIEVAS